MYYEITVSLHNKHLFATHPRSITGDYALRQVVAVLGEKFPEKEGFTLSVTHYPDAGRSVTWQQVREAIANGKGMEIFEYLFRF